MSATNKSVRHEPCYMSEALDLIGGKWPVLVLGALSRGTLRYSDPSAAVQGISQRMPTLSPKELEASGLVKRTIFPTVPPRSTTS